MNQNSCWFSSGTVLTRTLSSQLLISNVKDCKILSIIFFSFLLLVCVVLFSCIHGLRACYWPIFFDQYNTINDQRTFGIHSEFILISFWMNEWMNVNVSNFFRAKGDHFEHTIWTNSHRKTCSVRLTCANTLLWKCMRNLLFTRYLLFSALLFRWVVQQ